jgi:acetate kinase
VNVLALNAGSSSLKFRLLRAEGQEEVLAWGLVEKWGTPQAKLRMELPGKEVEHRAVAAGTPIHAAEHAIKACVPLGIDAIAHRVVHGGGRFHEPARITPAVVAAIREAAHFAPLHNGLALAGIEAGTSVLPHTPAVAIFDTAFHQTIPEFAAQYAIPHHLAAKHGLRRYGFHGISHEYVSGCLLKCLGRPAKGTRLITCHLGNGCSICAVRDGKSIDTSMGMTPMEGLMMGTRSGDIDPGLVVYFLTTLGMEAKQVDDLLNHRSGMAGVSGTGGDLRDIEKKLAGSDPQAELALEMFAYRVRKYIGAYAVVLGGVDAISFAGGIGEHSPAMRWRICAGLGFLGIALDSRRNEKASGEPPAAIHAEGSAAAVWVIATDEERQMAREVRRVLGKG